MKKFLLSLLTLTGLLVACSPDKKDNRWEPYTPSSLPESERRVVLVEEYTGQRCVNCPEAAKELHEIEKSHPNHLIIVSMHSMHSGLALEELASSEATRLAKHYGLPTAIPGVMISRRSIGGEGLYTRTRSQWASDIAHLINSHKILDIEQTKPAYDEAQDALDWSVTLRQASGSDAEYTLTAWLVEDVIAEQVTISGKVKDYHHHNVHRAVLTEASGKSIRMIGNAVTISLNAKGIKDKVEDINNAKVVVFVQRPGSDEILSANIVALGDGSKGDDKGKDPNNGNEDPNQGGGNEQDEEAKKQEEIKRQADVSFALFNMAKKSVVRRYAKGEEIILNEVEGPYNNMYELISPIFFPVINKPEATGTYQVIVSKESHLDDTQVGITTFCANGQCVPSPEPKASWDSPVDVVSDNQIDSQQSLQVHYGLPATYDQEETYKLKMTLLLNGKEINHIYLLCQYKKPEPKKKKKK